MDENTSEDGAKDIADFVVSQGKEFFIPKWWTNPERIPATIDRGDTSTFTGIAAQVFWGSVRRVHSARDRLIVSH